mmetsp:Transcript_41535/g.104740  ORF Transcript_41535/g.104740 Transcript_41535/m.104740 type:complete len:249 (-) Transcript_41535:128-874(-)
MTAILEEHMRVHSHDASLIGLRDISKHDIDHIDEHAVFVRCAGITDDGNDVGALLGGVDQIAAGAMRELNGVHAAGWADDVRHMRDSGTRGSTQVENLGTGTDPDVLDTTQNGGGDLGTERVPHTVLDLLSIRTIDADALLAIYILSRNHVAGNQCILFATSQEDTGMTMLFDKNLGTTLHAATCTTATSAASSARATTTSAASSTAASATTTTSETATGSAASTTTTSTTTTSAASATTSATATTSS